MANYGWTLRGKSLHAAAFLAAAVFSFGLLQVLENREGWAEERPSGSAEELLQRGAFQEAREEALIRDDGASLRVRALFALWDGEDGDALRFGEAARGMRSRPEEARRSEAMYARLQWLRGERDEAIESLRGLLRVHPEDLEVRYELGAMLVDDGAIAEGKGILHASAQRFNDGLIQDVEELVWLGRAMMVGERPRDANRAFSRALRVDENHLEANLRFGELMWSRYNTAEAEEAFERVLEAAPDHPEALAAMAEIEFFRSGRFPEAMALIETAEAGFPGHPTVLRKKAHLLLAQGEWEAGLRVAERVLERFPDDSEALSLKASGAYLLSMDEAYREARERYDRRRSAKPDLLARVGELLALNRRNTLAAGFFEAALERDGEYGPALTGLGFALTRIGEESRGLDLLERAFAVDSFNVRVYNTLELYEKGLRDYLIEDVEGFRLRAHMSHFDLIRELSEPLVNEAVGAMAERYGVELEKLVLEIYADRDAFSVRTVGLPHIDPHGICFGPVVLTRSPGEGNFNWAMVLWHELAHSFHLELSDYGVPRWFTEGLAEYETYLHNPSWTRFHDLDLARRLQHGRLWAIQELDQAFMTARGIEVSYAYQTAMLVMAFLDEVHGFEVIVEMLRAFAEEGRSDRVFEAVLGESAAETDRAFREWLGERFSVLMATELVDLDRVRRMQRGEEVEHRSRGEASIYRGLLAAAAGEREEARLHLDNARRRGGEEPAVLVGGVMLLDMIDDVEGGLELGRQALDAGVESYDLRYAMARMSGRAERHEEAFVHALAAAMSYPNEPEGWRMLLPRARRIGAEGLARQAEQELFLRHAHAPELARQALADLEERGDREGAHQAARRWAEIAGMDAEAQLAVARTALVLGMNEEAKGAYFRASLASPARRASILSEGIEALRASGADETAKALEELQ